MAAVAARKIEFFFKEGRLDVQTAGDDYKVYRDLNQDSLVHEGIGPIKLINCKLNSVAAKGDIELQGCTVRKTVEAAGNIFCRYCPFLGIVKSAKAICDWNCETADLLDAAAVYTIGEVVADIRTPDGKAYLFPGYAPKNLKGPSSAIPIDCAYIDHVRVEKPDPEVSLLAEPPSDDEDRFDPELLELMLAEQDD